LLLRRTECALPVQPDISELRTASPGTLRTDPVARWYALYTRARHEKRVVQRLNRQGIQVFLPLIPRERQWHDRKTVVDWPLFPGYVFARLRGGATSLVLSTPGVVTIVSQNGSPAPIRDEVIEGVRRLAAVAAETGTIPKPSPLVHEGRRVRITSGPLRGLEGVILQRRGGDRVLVQFGVQAIGQGLKVEVEANLLRLLESTR
jgi:transcription elongation factor/antiterminator RfaH